MSMHRFIIGVAALTLTATAGNALAQQPPKRDLAPRIEADQARINLIRARIAHVQDATDLRNLQATFGFYFDKALWDDIVDLMADDATLELGKNGVYKGKDSIRAYLYSLTGGKPGLEYGQLNDTIQLQPVITIADDGKSAKARWNALLQTAADYDENGSGGEWGGGVYENSYVKEDGVWKIRSIRFYLDFYAPYDKGWTRGPKDMVNRYLASDVTPDAKSSGAYKSYPGFDIPPFSYKNPVASGYTFGLSEKAAKKARGAAPHPVFEKTVDSLEAQVRDLELQIRRLKAYDEVENLQSAYGYYVDQSMGDEIADLFDEDATLEILGRGVFIGLPRIETYMERLGCCGPAPNVLFNHMQLQNVIHVAPDGRTANVRARLFVMFGRQGQAGQWGTGVYENQFIFDDGVWKYRNEIGYQTFYTFYDKGWGRESSELFTYFPGFPPDQPHSVEYEPYPHVFVPPFHYPNPVTGQPVRIPEPAADQ